jgi:hypothetical protein
MAKGLLSGFCGQDAADEFRMYELEVGFFKPKDELISKFVV